MSIDREELAELCDARDKICNFCEAYDDCEKCKVTLLIDQAHNECFNNSRTYRCLLCGKEFCCEDDYDFDCNVEEELWGHIQMEHEEEFEECQDWDTPYMVEEYFERKDS